MVSTDSRPITLDELIGKLEELPPLSDTAARLAEAIEHPACSIEKLAAVVERDATLAQRVLKLANSAFYSVPGGVASINRAVTFVGFSSVHQISLYVSSMAILNQTRTMPPRLVEHAATVATIGRYLAVEKRLANRDAALAAGMLHDLGWLALHALFPEVCRHYAAAVEKGADHGEPLEQEVMGVTHQEVGTRLAANWRFPAALACAIGGHHGPGQPPETLDDAHQQLSDVVAVADAWASVFGKASMGAAVPGSGRIDSARLLRLKLGEAPTPEQHAALEVLLQTGSVII